LPPPAIALSASHKCSSTTYRSDLDRYPATVPAAPLNLPRPTYQLLAALGNGLSIFERVLERKESLRSSIGEPEWARIVSETILKAMRDLILAKVPRRCQIQMRIDALYTLIEISTAIGYAPRGISPGLIHSGDVLVPGFLIKGMCKRSEGLGRVGTETCSHFRKSVRGKDQRA
jgi:hypothetical protein